MKSDKIQGLILRDSSFKYDSHYLGYFKQFNDGRYYEAHDVLEALWLPSRGQSLDLFYKGLIQLAGAFVHLQKGRLKPAVALLNLSEKNLLLFPENHEGMDLLMVLQLIKRWREEIERNSFTINPLGKPHMSQPILFLEGRNPNGGSADPHMKACE